MTFESNRIVTSTGPSTGSGRTAGGQRGRKPLWIVMVLNFMYTPRVARTVFADLPHHKIIVFLQIIKQAFSIRLRNDPIVFYLLEFRENYFKKEIGYSLVTFVAGMKAILAYEHIVNWFCK
jgi:hypothetical protein